MNRETWLETLVAELRHLYGDELPEEIRLSVGFPASGAGSRRIGECWRREASANDVCQIFVHPKLDDGVEVGAVVVHELIHACRPDAKHGPQFRDLAETLGLEGKMTATTATEGLKAQLEGVIKIIGPYPHAALNTKSRVKPTEKKPDKRKRTCPECGYEMLIPMRHLAIAEPKCPVDKSQMEGVAES